MADIAVTAEGEAVMKRLLSRVLLCLEAREDSPQDREDPEKGDQPCERAEADDDRAMFTDGEPRSAPLPVGHARSSSLKRLERTRSANVAMMIEKITTTIA